MTPRLLSSTTSPISPSVISVVPIKGSTPKASLPASVPPPVKPFLGANITPRSASRRARIGTASPTSNGSAHSIRQDLKPSALVASPLSQKTSPYLALSVAFRADSGATKRPASVVTGDGIRSGGSRSPEIAARKAAPLKTTSTIFYANGAEFESDPATSPPAKSEPPASKSACFFYANGTILDAEPASASPTAASPRNPTAQPSPTRPEAGRRGATDLNVALAQKRLEAQQSVPDHPRRRTVSSSQEAGVDAMSSKNVSSSLPRPIRPASAASSVHENFKGLSIDKKPDISPAVLRWREQLESRKSSHGRFGSATSEGGNCHDQKHLESSPRPSLASMTPTKRVSFPTALSGPPSPAGTPGDSALKGEGLPLSPTSAYFAADDSPQHRLQQMNDQAANARTERKVLDLEISNSSLMAINRTLEREMRKQNAELRRFRRLSRSGRLSLATSSARTLSGHRMSTLSDDHDLHCDLSDLSETVSEMVSSEADSIDDTALSPDAQAASDARHWERDEKRLQLDLSKHQRLLVDSQKMNQSLKKCLGWTEELISEGKKALAFKVRLSDIGGRVLALDDVGHNAAKEASPLHSSPSTSSTPLAQHGLAWSRPLSPAAAAVVPTILAVQEKEGTDAAITVERGAAAE